MTGMRWVRFSYDKKNFTHKLHFLPSLIRHDEFLKLKKTAKYLNDTLKREPTKEEIACEMGIPITCVKRLLRKARKLNLLDIPFSKDENENTAPIQLRNKRFILRICSKKALLYEPLDQIQRATLILCSDYPLPTMPQFKSFLYAPFLDVEEAFLSSAIKLEDCRRILRFLNEIPNGSTVYLACDSGASRSPALAASILTLCGLKDDIVFANPHYDPNMLVFRTMLNAGGKLLPEKDIIGRALKSRKAYTDVQRGHCQVLIKRWEPIDMSKIDRQEDNTAD